jgi:hypothetical protein
MSKFLAQLNEINKPSNKIDSKLFNINSHQLTQLSHMQLTNMIKKIKGYQDMLTHTLRLIYNHPTYSSDNIEIRKQVSKEVNGLKGLPICPKCGKELEIRKGPYGMLLGCTGYVVDDDNSCKYMYGLPSNKKEIY